MIFPDVSLKEWLARYPVLSVMKSKCHHCKRPMVTNLPFIERDWVGIQSPDCVCGNGKGISVFTTRPSSENYNMIMDWVKKL